MFHVAFRDYLQEQLLVKMKRPPLVHEDEWDAGEEGEAGEEAGGGEEEEQQEGGQWTSGLCLYAHVYMYVLL